MNKNDIDKLVAKKLNFNQKEITIATDCFIETIIDEVINGNRVMLTNLGSFSIKKTYPRKQWDGINKKYIMTEGAYLPRFVFSKALQERIKIVLGDKDITPETDFDDSEE